MTYYLFFFLRNQKPRLVAMNSKFEVPDAVHPQTDLYIDFKGLVGPNHINNG
jgi:hypothetical protein